MSGIFGKAKGFVSSPMGGYVVMILSYVAMVVWFNLFVTIMGYFDDIYTYEHISSFTLLQLGVKIAPAIIHIMMLGVFMAGQVWGHQTASKGSGIQTILWVVFTALQIILFLAMFVSILDALYQVLSLATIANYIALEVVVQMSAALLFLWNIFALPIWNVATTVKSYKKGKSSSALPAST